MTAEDIDPSQWIRRYGQPAQAKTRLICLPHAGGDREDPDSPTEFQGLVRYGGLRKQRDEQR